MVDVLVLLIGFVTLAQISGIHDWLFRLGWDLWSVDSVDIDGLLDWLVENNDFSISKLFLLWRCNLMLGQWLLFRRTSHFNPATWQIFASTTSFNLTWSSIRLHSVKLRLKARFKAAFNHWSTHLWLRDVKIRTIVRCLILENRWINLYLLDLDMRVLWHYIDVMSRYLIKFLLA